MGGETVIELREVVALAGGFPVLSGFTVIVDSGDVSLLVGPNGAGKSSVLRLCAGLIAPYSGTARVLNCDLYEDQTSFRSQIGYCGHANGLYEDLTAEENVTFVADAFRVDRAKVDFVCDQLAIGRTFRSTQARLLSAGQKRRVALAGVLVRQPKLLLLDEPHAGLDADTRDVVDELIRGHAEAGGAVLFASHELERASSIATTQIGIDGGANVLEKEPIVVV